VLFSLLLLLLVGQAFADVKELLRERYGSKEALKRNAEVPLHGEGQMKTVDGTKSFSVNFRCLDKAGEVRIAFLPVPGNEYRLLVREDLDADGRYEYVYDSGFSVSGVCHSGVVSCDPPGSWQNCKFYYWKADKGYVKLVPTTDDRLLGACFCSNASCGITSPDKAIVDTVVGGIARALTEERKDLGTAGGEFDLSSFEAVLYVGSEGCFYEGVQLVGEENPTYVYEAQSPPDGFSYANTGLYSLVGEASKIEVKGGSVSYPKRYTCTQKKTVSITTETRVEDCNTYSFNGMTWCLVAHDYKPCGCHVCARIGTQVSLKPTQELLLVVPGFRDNCDDDGNTIVWSVTGDGELSGSGTCGSFPFRRTTVIPLAKASDRPLNLYVKAERCHTGYCGCSTEELLLLKSREYKEDVIKLETQACEQREGCVLKNEWVCDHVGQNCIQTVREGVRLGIKPERFCYEIKTQVDAYTVCADGQSIEVVSASGRREVWTGEDSWFFIKREYECPPSSIGLDLSRAEAVIGGSAMSGNVLTYGDGGKTHSVSVNLSPTDCPAVCTVLTTSRSADVFVDKTNRAQVPAGADRPLYERRVCRDGVCPVAEGEKVIEPCSCEQTLLGHGFTYTISVLGSVVEAAKDIICSGSPP